MDAVRLLINSGATIRSLDNRGLTPLDVAQRWQHEHVFSFLYNQSDHSVKTDRGVSKPPWTGVADMKWSNAPQPPLADDETLKKKYFGRQTDKSGDPRYQIVFVSQMEKDLKNQGRVAAKKKKRRKAKARRTAVRR